MRIRPTWAALAGMTALVLAGVGGDAGAAAKHDVAFRGVLIAGIPPTTDVSADPSVATTVAGCDVTAVAALITIPTTSAADDDPHKCVVLADRKKTAGSKPRYYLGPSEVGGSAIKSATSDFVSSQGWILKIRFTKRGAAAWDALAEKQFHNQVAIVLDHRVISAPTIQPGEATFSSFDGTAVISGRFGQREAKDLAAAINLAR